MLIVQRGPGGLWEGFWEFPTDPRRGRRPGRAVVRRGPVDLAEGVRRLTGVRARIGPVGRRPSAYGVTRHRVALDAHAAAGLTDGPDARARAGPGRLGAPESSGRLPVRLGRAAGWSPGSAGTRGTDGRRRIEPAGADATAVTATSAAGRPPGDSPRRPCSDPDRTLE